MCVQIIMAESRGNIHGMYGQNGIVRTSIVVSKGAFGVVDDRVTIVRISSVVSGGVIGVGDDRVNDCSRCHYPERAQFGTGGL